jgi:hypothetical protein
MSIVLEYYIMIQKFAIQRVKKKIINLSKILKKKNLKETALPIINATVKTVFLVTHANMLPVTMLLVMIFPMYVQVTVIVTKLTFVVAKRVNLKKI